MFVFTGTIINSTSIAGNKYMNFSALLLVSIPTRIITAITLTKFGRKAPICVAYVLCCVFFIASAFVPKSLCLGGVPDHVAQLTNAASTVGRLGAVLAPQTPLLEQYMGGLPSIVFGLAALGAAALALLLPDTSRAALPDRVADAERIGSPASPDLESR
ncbi:hypothetical protein ACJJTC_007354 [Scirpophaga incertulas]